MQYKKIVKTVLYIVVVLFFISLIVDLSDVLSNKTYKRNPEHPFATHEDEMYLQLLNNTEPDWQRLRPTLNFIKNEYDVADFKLVNLIRILYAFETKIPDDIKKEVDETLLNFRYWMDEPGKNSMCYWSENHQILFSSAEFLIGKRYNNKLFGNSGMTGAQHAQKARKRILDWLEMRWLHGFTEFYSGTYYIEDIAALLNLIDYANDEELVIKSSIVLDLIFYDVSTQINKGYFTTVSGRAYKNNRTGFDNDLGGVVSAFVDSISIRHGLLNGLYATKYKLPEVLKEIAADTANVIIKQKHGLALQKLKTSVYNGTDEKSMMMQWGMEAFVNPETVRNTMYTVRKNKMFSNDFLKDLKLLDFAIIRWLRLEPVIVKIINIPQQGKAIQEANTYTYKTKNYSLYSVQNYFPGSYADQHHVAGMNIGNSFSVFHTHPAREKNVAAHSPDYWVGYGRLPHVAQDENISLSIYTIPQKKNILEKELLHYTYAYFPERNFDSVYIYKNFAFGKKENTYCALIANNEVSFKDTDKEELVQEGNNTFWIIEAGSLQTDGSFNAFYQRILTNEIAFNENNNQLQYTSKGRKYVLSYKGQFIVDGKFIDTEYPRFSQAYSSYNNGLLTIQHNNKTLQINFNKLLRKEQP